MTASAPTTARPDRPVAAPRGVLRLLAGAGGLVATAALLWWAGSAIPGPGSFDQRGLLDWARTADPVVVAVAAVRVLGLALAGWIALTGVAATVVHASRLRRRRRLRRLVDRACFPLVRRLVHGATGTLLVAATLAPGTVAGAAPADRPPAVATAPALPAAPEVARLRPLSDEGPGAVPTADDLHPVRGPEGPATPTDPSGPTTVDVDVDVAVLRPLDTAPAAAATSDPGGGEAGAPPTTLTFPPTAVDPGRPPSPPHDDALAAPPTPAPGTWSSPTTGPTNPAPSGPSTSAAQRATAAPMEIAVLRSLDPAPTPGPPSGEPPSAPVAASSPSTEAGPGRTWTVAPGDHLWHVADATLTADLGAPADVATVARYLDELIAANRDRLVLPDDPDLVFAGQVLVLPDTPGAPA